MIFWEPFAGSAAVSLALIGGRRCLPPLGYMGSKRRYVEAILGIVGLTPGDGADAVILSDAGPWGWAWQGLLQPEIARAVGVVLRSWREENPVELWKRLAASDPPEELCQAIATWCWLQARSANSCPVWWDESRSSGSAMGAGKVLEEIRRQQRDGDLPADAADEIPAAARGWRMGDKPRTVGRGDERLIQQEHRPQHTETDARQKGRSAALGDGEEIASDRFERIRQKGAGVPGIQPTGGPRDREIRPKGRGGGRCRGMIDPGTIAARLDVISHALATWTVLQAGNYGAKPVEIKDGAWKTAGYGHEGPKARARGFVDRVQPESLAESLEALSEVRKPSILAAHARCGDLPLPADLSEWVIYADPPYINCTGYAAHTGREEMLSLALDWRARGAVVVVSEGVPMPLDGWHHVELRPPADGGPGVSTTRKAGEWLTCSNPPVRRPTEQLRMFG